MSNRPGRNTPCPCGSGKKYKHCCLASDEAAARERAPQLALFDDTPLRDSDLAIEHHAFFDVEGDEAPLDTRAVVRVRYSRGLVNNLSDLRSSRGVQVAEWQAPHIPQTVLESIEREAVDALEGEWGHPQVGDPIQVDLIDLETDTDVISIHVFNRAICLVRADSEEMRRIHRVCCVLDAAGREDQAADQGDAGWGTTAVAIERSNTRRFSDVDMTAVWKQHRRQGGTCALCGEALTRERARKHLAACVPAHDVATGCEVDLREIRVAAPGLPGYWLDLEVKAEARLDALDSFLRGIWVECCGHLSAFNIGAVKYLSRGYDFGFARAFGSFRQRRISERSMTARIGEVLPPRGVRFDYEYDFGSTTRLQLKVVSERTGRRGRAAVRLLAQNTAPVWPCAVCGEPATAVCVYCLDGDAGAFVCAVHAREHGCGEPEGVLPVVNSPRMGVCGYVGEP